MSEPVSSAEVPRSSMHVFPEYGVHTSGDISLVSCPTWDQALLDVQGENFGKNIVVLPELITIAGKTFSGSQSEKPEVEKSLETFSEFSTTQPDATFVLGSPHYVEGIAKPYNGAYVIKDGEILAIAHKHIAALGENAFTMDTTQPAIQVGDTSIAICKDATAIAMPPDPNVREYLLKAYSGDPLKGAEMRHTTFLAPEAKRLVILAAWGMGIHPRASGKNLETQKGINTYYEDSLKYTVEEIFKNNNHLDEIIVSDRTIVSPNPLQDRVASHPMSLIAHR